MLKCVVPVSGGKDSQACLKLALSVYSPDEILGLFCDTKFEHPLTYAHINRMRSMYGVRIESICAGSVYDKVIKYLRFPGGGARHCTDELKIAPSRRYYESLSLIHGGFEVWYGVRTQESSERSRRYAGKVGDEVYAPHEFMPGKYPKKLAKAGVVFRLPVIDWTFGDVVSYVGEENLNPLYKEFDRVGCFPCLASGDKWKEKAFAYDQFGSDQKEQVISLELITGKSVWTSKSGKERNCGSGCSLCSI